MAGTGGWGEDKREGSGRMEELGSGSGLEAGFRVKLFVLKTIYIFVKNIFLLMPYHCIINLKYIYQHKFKFHFRVIFPLGGVTISSVGVWSGTLTLLFM